MRTASSGGFVTTKALANYGNETLNSNVAAKAWLYNRDKANLTINGELSIGQGLENSGLLDSDTISAAANVYNRASGSIITDQLSLTGSNSFSMRATSAVRLLALAISKMWLTRERWL